MQEMHKGLQEQEYIRQERKTSTKLDKLPEVSELNEYAAIFDVDPTEAYDYDSDVEPDDELFIPEGKSHCANG